MDPEEKKLEVEHEGEETIFEVEIEGEEEAPSVDELLSFINARTIRI